MFHALGSPRPFRSLDPSVPVFLLRSPPTFCLPCASPKTTAAGALAAVAATTAAAELLPQPQKKQEPPA